VRENVVSLIRRDIRRCLVEKRGRDGSGAKGGDAKDDALAAWERGRHPDRFRILRDGNAVQSEFAHIQIGLCRRHDLPHGDGPAVLRHPHDRVVAAVQDVEICPGTEGRIARKVPGSDLANRRREVDRCVEDG
jgi:hypothetical protein